MNVKPATNYHSPMMATRGNSGENVSRDEGVSMSTWMLNSTLVLVEIPQVKTMVRLG